MNAPKCECAPCPGRGNDGHGMTHCAECCFGSRVEADADCPTHGVASVLQAWLNAHAPATDHDKRIIDADLLPGSSRTPVGDEDPYGHRANEAAAHDWWAQVEPDKGRWAT
jgi:hypothetical protein